MVIPPIRKGKRPSSDSQLLRLIMLRSSSPVLSKGVQKTLTQTFLKLLSISASLETQSLAFLSYLRRGGSYQVSISPSIFEMQLPSNVSSSRLTQDSKPSILERLLLLNEAHFKFSNFSRFVISKRCCPSKFKAVIYTIIHITCYFWILQTNSKLLDLKI